MKTIKYLFLLFSSMLFAQTSMQTNVQNENKVQNTYFMRFNHQADPANSGLEANTFFKPYLAYGDNTVDPNNGEYSMMDSFVFHDSYYAKHSFHWDGIYNMQYFEYYLNNIFTRTKLPIIKNDPINDNNYAVIENKKSPILSYKMNKGSGEGSLEPLTTYQVNFDIKRNVKDYFIKCFENPDGEWVNQEEPNPTSNEVHIGIQYLDQDCRVVEQSIDDNLCFSEPPEINNGLSYFQNSLDYCYSRLGYSNGLINVHTGMISGEIPDDEFIQINFTFTTPESGDFDYSKLIIYNVLGYEKEILIDDVLIRKYNGQGNSLGDNILSPKDEKFDIESNITRWEYEKKFTNSNTFLFKNRESLLDELKNAKDDKGSNDTTKVILMLPKIDHRFNPCTSRVDSYYFDSVLLSQPIVTYPEKALELKEAIKDYIVEIGDRFNAWKAENPNSNIEIAGLYYGDEDIRYENEYNFLEPFLNFAKDIMPDSWQLYGSPFTRKLTDCSIESSYVDTAINGAFDVCWVQPNAFFNNNVDRDFIEKVVLDIAKPKKTGVNIENRVLNFVYAVDPLDYEAEDYSKIQDYYDYNYKLGAINYPKLYFDDGGAHYKNSLSSSPPAEKIDYDNLHQFIRSSKKGVVVNNRFEHIIDNELTGDRELFNWVGNYDIEDNIFSTSIGNRKLEFKTDASNPKYDSEFISVTESNDYTISFQSKELQPEVGSSGVLVVSFYDNNDQSIGGGSVSVPGLAFSTVYGAYFKGIINNNEFQNTFISFTVPTGAVKMQFYITKYLTANTDIEWKDIKIHNGNSSVEPEIFYAENNNTTILKKEKRIKNGTSSLNLNYAKYAEMEERISINNDKNYKISIDIKENLPIHSTTDPSKAYIGLKAYDKDGQLLTASSHINGLWSGGYINTYYANITNITQDWSTFSVDEINFSNEVASIQIVVRNLWYDNTLLFDNLKFEYVNETYEPNKFPLENLLEKEKWNERFPATVIKDKPVYYNELINIENMTSLEFSAHFKDENRATLPIDYRFFGVEFLDSNYNIINTTSSSDLAFSPYYEYWFDQLFDDQLLYDDCDPIVYNGPIPGKDDSKWYYNKWRKETVNFTTPSNAKWMRLLITNNNSSNSIRMLNPILVNSSAGRNSSGYTQNFKEENSINENTSDSFKLYPNPTRTNVTVELNKFDNKLNNTFQVYDVTGKLILNGNFKSNRTSLNISHLESGIYFVKVIEGNKIYTKKMIKN